MNIIQKYTQRKYKEAIEDFHKSFKIKEKIFGKVHSYTATLYNNIGLLYKSLKDNINT